MVSIKFLPKKTSISKLVIWLLIIFYGCTATKSTDKSLSISDISLGKAESAVMGIVKLVQQETPIKVTVIVENSRQGSASAKVFTKNTSLTVLVRPLTLERYKNTHDIEMMEEMKVGKRVLMTIQFLPGTDEYVLENVWVLQ